MENFQVFLYNTTFEDASAQNITYELEVYHFINLITLEISC